MKIFITGATGFVGHHIIETFRKANDKILILKLPEEEFEEEKNIKCLDGDFSDLAPLKTKIINFNPDVANAKKEIDLWADIDKIKMVLNWSPKIPIQDGFKICINHLGKV